VIMLSAAMIMMRVVAMRIFCLLFMGYGATTALLNFFKLLIKKPIYGQKINKTY
jgi:hypothetical protein